MRAILVYARVRTKVIRKAARSSAVGSRLMPSSRPPLSDVTNSCCNGTRMARDNTDVIAPILEKMLAPTPRWALLPAVVVRLVSGAIFLAFGLSKFSHHGREARAFARYG